MKLEAEEDTARIILNREERFEIQVGSESGKGRSAFEAALGNQWQWKGGGKVQMGEWTHVAAVWDGKVMRLFVGGKKAAEHDLPDGAPFAAGGGALRVGARGAPNEPSGVFRGLMDELRISSKARYTADFTPPAEPFKPDAATMALWHFDEGKLTKPGPVKLGREPQDGMWLMISGFSNEGAKGFDAAYPPEKVVDLRGRYRLGDGTRARWKLIKSPGSVYDLRTFDERFNIVYYAFAYLRSAADQEATLVTNSDDGIKVWLNGKVIVSENVYRGLDDGGDKRTKVQLKKGLNSVLLKVTQGEGDAAFRCYVEGAKAKVSRTARGPVTGIKE